MRAHRTMKALLALLVAVLAIVALAPSAGAGGRNSSVTRLNTDLWRTLLTVPKAYEDPTHPYHTGVCLRYDHVVAPFQDGSLAEFSCYVRPGTPLLISGLSGEFSAVEAGDPKASEATLRKGAIDAIDANPVPTVRLDGRPLHLRRVVGPLTSVTLPAKNLLDGPAGPTNFVAAGLVAVIRPSRGCHAVTIKSPNADPTKPPTYIVTYLQVGNRVDCDLESAEPR